MALHKVYFIIIQKLTSSDMYQTVEGVLNSLTKSAKNTCEVELCEHMTYEYHQVQFKLMCLNFKNVGPDPTCTEHKF